MLIRFQMISVYFASKAKDRQFEAACGHTLLDMFDICFQSDAVIYISPPSCRSHGWESLRLMLPATSSSPATYAAFMSIIILETRTPSS